MIKNTFIYVILLIFIGVAVWFFVQKSENSENSEAGKLIGQATTTPTPMLQDNNISSPVAEVKWTKLDNDLQYQDVVVGSGREAKPGDMVAAHYSGTLVDGTKFDSSYDRGEPFAFILGGGMVIKGWDMGIEGMKVGGKRKLIIPPQLGYGAQARGPIPANATLLFDVELMAVQGAK